LGVYFRWSIWEQEKMNYAEARLIAKNVTEMKKLLNVDDEQLLELESQFYLEESKKKSHWRLEKNKKNVDWDILRDFSKEFGEKVLDYPSFKIEEK
jgi:hypothetical protein